MPQQSYLQIFRQRWIAIAAGLVLGALVALGVAAIIPASYTATATSFLSVQSTTGSLTDRSQFSLARVASYPALADSSDVLQQTITQLGLHETVQQLSKSVSATNPATTVLVQVTASASSAKQAALIANTVAANLSTTVSSLEDAGSQDRYKVTLELRDRAQPPTSVSAPQRTIILGLGVLGGIAVGLIAAILWAAFDTTIRSPEDVRSASGFPVIGELPRQRRFRVFKRGKIGSQLELSLRETQLTVRQANGDIIPRLIAVVPANAAAGRLSVRTGLAQTFAESGLAVALVETDFRSRITELVPDAAKSEGLAEALAGTTGVLPLVVEAHGEKFSVLPAGIETDLPSELVAEQNVPSVVRSLTATFDVTIAQVTSTSRPGSLELITPYADGVVVVVRYGRTRRAELGHVMSRLRLGGIRPLGVIVSGVPLYRLSNLAASWQQGDFNEIPREPLRSLSARRSVVVPAIGATAGPELEPVEISPVPVPASPVEHAPVSARDHTRSLADADAVAGADADADADADAGIEEEQTPVVDVEKQDSPAVDTPIASDTEPEASTDVKPATPAASPAPRRKTSRQGTRAARRRPAPTGATTHSNASPTAPDVAPEALSEK